MSTDLLIDMLRKGETGNDILQILDAITSSEDEVVETEEVSAQ
jgi:hypothetical protein